MEFHIQLAVRCSLFFGVGGALFSFNDVNKASSTALSVVLFLTLSNNRSWEVCNGVFWHVICGTASSEEVVERGMSLLLAFIESYSVTFAISS